MSFGACVAQVRALGKAPADEKLHELRIRVKRVRYAAELGGLRGGARTARVIGAATSLQDILGAHQDAVVAEQRIRALAERSDDPSVAFAAGPAGRAAEAAPRRRFSSSCRRRGAACASWRAGSSSVSLAGSRMTRATPSASAARATALATAGTTSRLKTLGMM